MPCSLRLDAGPVSGLLLLMLESWKVDRDGESFPSVAVFGRFDRVETIAQSTNFSVDHRQLVSNSLPNYTISPPFTSRTSTRLNLSLFVLPDVAPNLFCSIEQPPILLLRLHQTTGAH